MRTVDKTPPLHCQLQFYIPFVFEKVQNNGVDSRIKVWFFYHCEVIDDIAFTFI